MTAPVTRVFLVRHGATVLSAEDRFAGATDVELSEEGREQTRRLAERLSDEKIAAVYASPMGRTVETARILAAPHDIEVQTRDGFREISHGHWEGMKRRDVEEKFPQEMAEWEKDPYTFAPAGGESGLAVTARALPALIDLVREHPGGDSRCPRTRLAAIGDEHRSPRLRYAPGAGQPDRAAVDGHSGRQAARPGRVRRDASGHAAGARPQARARCRSGPGRPQRHATRLQRPHA